MHLAAACGMRVVVLAGPTKHERTGPWPTAKLLGAADASSVHTAVRSSDPPSCAPCLRRECTHPRGPVCMSTIDAATVAAAVAQNISVG
jgi:ADP-heptose:LPS heptosyltransferase